VTGSEILSQTLQNDGTVDDRTRSNAESRTERNMTAKTITTPHESPKAKDHEHEKQESLAKTEMKELDRELDRELADSFPASDSPSVTQPAPKWGPERKHSTRR
jgi:hypothetical protein